MTVQNTPNFVDYVGDDATLVFNFTFRVDDVSWLFVDFTDDFDQFNVNLDQENNPGGNATYLVAPPSPGMGGPDPSFRVERIVPANQNLDYTRYGPFDAEASEAALDKLTMILQDQVTIIAVGDAFLQSGLDQEIIDRAAADVILQNNIDAEAATRLANDNTEIALRIAGDAAVTAAYIAADNLVISNQLITDTAQDALINANLLLITTGGSPGHTHVLADITDYVAPIGTVPAGSITGELLRWNQGTVAWEVTPYLFPAADGGAGQVLTTDGLGNITFQPGGGGGSLNTPADIIGDINMATPPVAAAFTGELRIVDNDETDVIGTFGYDGDAASPLYIRNLVTNGMIIFEADEFGGVVTEVLRMWGGRSTQAGGEAYIMANRGIFNYVGTPPFNPADPPLMVTTGALEDGQTAPYLGVWNSTIQVFAAGGGGSGNLSIQTTVGGSTTIGSSQFGTGGVTINHGGNLGAKGQTFAGGWETRNNTTVQPNTGNVGNTVAFRLSNRSGTIICDIGARDSDDVINFSHQLHGRPFLFDGQNTAGSTRVLMRLEPDGASQIMDGLDNGVVAQTTTAALGGLFVDNQLTGAGLERVLTASDAGGGITVTGTPLNNQVAIWTGASDLEGDANFTYDGTSILLQTIGGTLLDLRDNNTTGGGASVKIDFTDQIGTLQASIGTFPVIDTLAILSAAGNVLISGLSVQVSGYFQRTLATDAELNAIANVINTSVNKIQGASFYNTDQDVPVYAVGNADGDVWVDGAGTTVNTPV